MSIQIFILSNLIEQSAYPYQLKKKLADFKILDLNNSLSESRLYYNFESLKKQGLIAVEEVLHEEHRPDKQMFTITEKGREQLAGKIYKVFEQAIGIDDMMVGLGNLEYVDCYRVLAILEKKLDKYKKNWAMITTFDSEKYVTTRYADLRTMMDAYTTERYEQLIRYMEQIIEYVEQYEKKMRDGRFSPSLFVERNSGLK